MNPSFERLCGVQRTDQGLASAQFDALVLKLLMRCLLDASSIVLQFAPHEVDELDGLRVCSGAPTLPQTDAVDQSISSLGWRASFGTR
jgi:hypothetical protein